MPHLQRLDLGIYVPNDFDVPPSLTELFIDGHSQPLSFRKFPLIRKFPPNLVKLHGNCAVESALPPNLKEWRCLISTISAFSFTIQTQKLQNCSICITFQCSHRCSGFAEKFGIACIKTNFHPFGNRSKTKNIGYCG